VLIALTDLKLRKEGADGPTGILELSAQKISILPGGSANKLTNTGSRPAKFITVEF
jgi:hypothetical protein